MKSLLYFALISLIVGCSGSQKKSEADAKTQTKSASHAPTTDEIQKKYSVTELNSAANLLKVVIDEGAKKPSEDKGTEIIGCSLTGAEAGAMTMPLKYLVDQALRFEIELYIADPKNYATEKGFETCAANCACGVLSDVVNGASESSIPHTQARNHSRNRQRLAAKAAHQTSRDSMACARKQSWFCGSDLKAYLLKQSPVAAQLPE